MKKLIAVLSLMAVTSACLANQVLSLDGKSGFVYVNSSADLQPVEAMTLEAWVFPIRSAMHSPTLFVKSDMLNERTYEVYWSSVTGSGYHDTLSFNLFLDGSVWACLEAPLASNCWTHVAAVFDSATGLLQIYTNGVFSISTTHDAGGATPLIGHTIHQSFSGLAFGTFPFQKPGSEVWAKGFMDDIRIWSVARSADEIAQNRFMQLTGSETNLTACWTFESGQPTDITGHGNDGDLFGNASVVSMVVSNTPPPPPPGMVLTSPVGAFKLYGSADLVNWSVVADGVASVNVPINQSMRFFYAATNDVRVPLITAIQP